jgi:enoyl-CoA hydratase
MIVREDRDSVAVLRLEHGKVNAIDVELLEAVSEQMEALLSEPPSAVVITGTGGAFSAGLDLVRSLDEGADYFRRLLPALNDALMKLFTLPRPVVAAVNGHAIAGGFVLACACDYRLMARGNGRLGITELPVGVPFPSVPLEMVRTVAGTRLTRDLAYSGRLLSADEGEALGVIEELVQPEDLMVSALDLAARWGATPAPAFELTKRQLQQPTLDRLAAHGAETDVEVLEVWTHDDTFAAIRRFVEKTLG